MNGITNEGLILACSAIGAGLAMIAGIWPWYRPGYCSWLWCFRSRKKSGCKGRYHVHHASWPGSSRDHRSVRTCNCIYSAVRQSASWKTLIRSEKE